MSASAPLPVESHAKPEQDLGQSQSDAIASFCKAAGDSLRLEILRVLHHNAYGVLELSQLFEMRQSGMSHHLKVLAKAGLVSTRREGNSIFYRRAATPSEATLGDLQRSLLETVDQIVLSDELQQRIDQINHERTRASREFFQQNADRFQANQDLIASYAQYGEIVTEFLDSLDIDHQTVLEVGPGEGDFLADLASRFKQVIALDNSAEMLNRSQLFAAEKNLGNVTFIHGDTGSIQEGNLKADCITLNMVLHHTPDPAHIFSDLTGALNTNGALLVTELCHHDQSWARQACGDLWLGFEPRDLSNWAAAAGLCEGESLFLAQRNGFQVQLRQFFKKSDVANQASDQHK